MSKDQRLIVEDNEFFRKIFKEITQEAGFSPVIESTVAGALSRLLADDYHDVWTDTILGEENCEPVVKAAIGKSIPVVVFSADDQALGLYIATKYSVEFISKNNMVVGDLVKIGKKPSA
jgi:DNA-binding response OmpR family regulator